MDCDCADLDIADSETKTSLDSEDEDVAVSKPVGKCLGMEMPDIEKLEDSYELEESIWDMSLLIGLDDVGNAGNIYCVFQLVLNIAVQLVFVWIIAEALTDPVYDVESVEGFRCFPQS